MHITIHGQDMHISDDMQDYTEDKLQKLSRYLPNIDEINVEYSKQNSSKGLDVIIAQVTVRHNRGAILRAEEKLTSSDSEGNTAQAALNGAIDKMYSRIRRFKGKRRSKKIRQRYNATPEELSMADGIPEDETDTQETSTIIRRKQIAIGAMTEDEAIEQMELLGHSFFVFHNADNGQTNVLYRRDQGGYGVLEPILE
ncbi:MAG: ribosome hibernation-promoting factor, HPF/YfiA family [Aggregatilineales bacterium]